MKKALFFLGFIIALVLTVPARAVAAESIKNFDATYNILQSGVVEVTEKIEYDFGPEYRHGIYRYVPYKYSLDNGETAYVNLYDFSVRDTDNSSYTYERYRENNNEVLKIGDADKTINGVHTYIISYKAKGAIRYLENSDEFYWNVNGTGWDVPVSRIKATVSVPDVVSSEDINQACYRGGYSSTIKCESTDVTGKKITFTDSGLDIAEGLTVVVGVPKGIIEKIDAGYLGSGMSTALVMVLSVIALTIPIFTFVFMLRHWWKYGRDPKGRGTIVAEYNPPNGLTPIEVGTLLDNRVDNKDISSEIIYLATTGHLKIRREPGSGIFKKDDYTLIRQDPKVAAVGFNNTLLTGIFGTSNEVLISSLKNDFYTHVTTIKSQVHDKLLTDSYFKGRVATTIGKYIGIGGAIGFFGFWLAMGLGALTNGVGTAIFAPSFIISGIIVGAFGLIMPARTAKGVTAKEQILGLKEYMSVAESDRIKFHNAPKKDPAKFEQLLPYAMVLGVEKEWAKQFEGIFKGNPGWYDDPTGRIFVPMIFVDNLNSFTSFATQNMISAPSSSGSGLGGGGFSGGGFGGGGGGSW